MYFYSSLQEVSMVTSLINQPIFFILASTPLHKEFHARVQGSGAQGLAMHPVALQHPQDRLGLAHRPVYILLRSHGSLQRCLPKRYSRTDPANTRHDHRGALHCR